MQTVVAGQYPLATPVRVLLAADAAFLRETPQGFGPCLMAWRRMPAGRGRRGPHLNLATADVLHDRETLDSHRYGVVRHSLKCARDGLFSPAAAPPSPAKVEEQRDEAQDSRGDNQWNGVLDAATWVSGAHGALLVAVVAQGGRRRRRNWRS